MTCHLHTDCLWKNRSTHSKGWRLWLAGGVVALFCVGWLINTVQAGDLLLPKEQEETQLGEIDIPAIDQSNWKSPQSVFSWIAMARDYETPWDSATGREGWFTTHDAGIKPIDPGVSKFSPDTEYVYIVFEVPPLATPLQWTAAWYHVDKDGIVSKKPAGTDAQEMGWNEKYGYFRIWQPDDGWKKGTYLVKMFYGSPGQQIHAANAVGTMQFTITEDASAQKQDQKQDTSKQLSSRTGE